MPLSGETKSGVAWQMRTNGVDDVGTVYLIGNPSDPEAEQMASILNELRVEFQFMYASKVRNRKKRPVCVLENEPPGRLREYRGVDGLKRLIRRIEFADPAEGRALAERCDALASPVVP